MKENRVAQNKEILYKTILDPFEESFSSAAFLCIKIGTWQL
ncbi:hypothetical protein T07_8406 [Trichinella nelsoni]|uniref:Uncharacterized protein n=1 Tax=Trichinella nelsoni TaxID=6336 RepID=A0A0V0RBL5_9BILA|nr:hypothetical protein T07_8406 [Trichinella nelsoni]